MKNGRNSYRAADKERVAYSFVGSELSRARGDRCLTMPLIRGNAPLAKIRSLRGRTHGVLRGETFMATTTKVKPQKASLVKSGSKRSRPEDLLARWQPTAPMPHIGWPWHLQNKASLV